MQIEVAIFDTSTGGLTGCRPGCTYVAMEATGVYWKPIWHILAEANFVLILANAAHVKNVPGRKTSGVDASWL